LAKNPDTLIELEQGILSVIARLRQSGKWTGESGWGYTAPTMGIEPESRVILVGRGVL
jgi:hypothetical protein